MRALGYCLSTMSALLLVFGGLSFSAAGEPGAGPGPALLGAGAVCLVIALVIDARARRA